jgi:hypothetical protein
VTALGSRLLSTLARKREARAAQERLVRAAAGLIRQASRSQGLYGQRSNTSVNIDGLARHVAHIDAALGRERG